jgi:aspartyl-tRNA(Asn)/glutamyl-tRNA(Gln) amidotransferase subunit A
VNATEDLAFSNATTVRDALANGDLNAEDYVDLLIKRIARSDCVFRAFVSVSADAALEKAVEADRNRAAGGKLPPLHGLPFAVKDLIDVRSDVTSANSQVSPQVPSLLSAAAVEQLESLGAIYLGKLALEEFGIGSELDDPIELRPKNPWDLTKSPGGSSSGSAVALAAGLIPLALGTDTTGSVRAPAAFCGIVGLKPSLGRVSRAGVTLLAPSLDTIGPMARSAKDCALLLSGVTRERAQPQLRPTRIGRVILDELEEEVSADVLQSLDAALDTLGSLGCAIGEIGPLPLVAMRCSADVIKRREAYQIHRAQLETSGSLYRAETRVRLLAGAKVGTADYRRALVQRGEFASTINQLLGKYDVLALPVTFAPAADYSDSEAMELAGDVAFRAPFSLTGHPAIVFCTGLTKEGLPLSMQLVGRRGEDECLLALVEAYQQVTSWHERHPPALIDGTDFMKGPAAAKL